MKLNPRQQNILRATVRHYVRTAEPVGSKSLASGYNLQVSAATIRNVMSALEESGLLYQPHTSAGRIPSDSGYRTYVDELMPSSNPRTHPLTRQMEQHMETLLSQRMIWDGQVWDGQVMESLLQESAQLLASLSGYIALVTLPQKNEAKVKHVQMVRVGNDQVLLVIIDTYENHSVLMPLKDPKSLETQCSEQAEREQSIDHELQILSNFLTEQLQGSSLRTVNLDWAELGQAFQHYIRNLEQAMMDLARRSQTNPATQILVSGLAEVLDQPEFSERSQIRSIVELLEGGRDQLWPLISTPPSANFDHSLWPADDDDTTATPNTERLRIWIGEENPVTPMQTCALVTSVYGQAPGPVGSLGVLGPTRMLYENAVAAVEAAASYLTSAVSDTLELGTSLTPES